VRLLAVSLVFCVAGLVGSSAAAFGEGTSSGKGVGSSPLLESPLVVPGVQPLDEGQQLRAAEEAKRSSPEAVLAREESRTKYENLNPEQAEKVAAEAFSKVINEPAGGPPKLSAGQSIVSYPANNAAQVDLPEGKRGVIESSVPIALEASPGHRVPVDLGLTEVGGAFEPRTPVVGLRIPKRLGEGVQLAGSGVSLTPVDAQGAPLGGSEGVVDGATVFYGGTGTDSDTVVKPTTAGFETDTLLRSVESPSTLSFHVGLPEGASLVSAKDGSGTVSIVDEGAVIAALPAPTAHDAEGTVVPVSMTVSTGTVVLSVAQHAGDYRYPIVVDPTVVDSRIVSGGIGLASNWQSEHNYTLTQWVNGSTLENTTTTAEVGEFGLWGYETHGESRIYAFTAETAATTSGTTLENLLDIVRPPGTIEASASLPSSYGTTRTELCSEPGCATGKVESGKENVAYFKQVVTKTREGGQSFTGILSAASVYILQEKGPYGSFNYTSPTFYNGYEQPASTNVLYANTWFAPYNNSEFKLEGWDPGIGIDKWADTSTPPAPEWEEDRRNSSTCVQCQESWGGSVFAYWTRFGHKLPDGEDTVEAKLYNATGASVSAQAKVKVDGTPPHEFTLAGLPPNKEIGNGIYHVKASAKDGSGSTPSSGVESLVLKVDGRQIGSANGSCSPGPCTATGEWTISGSEFGVGEHEVTVVATDKAKNVAEEKFTVFVARPTTPISMGPGSVDPQSGELTLNSTDASIGAANATLSVGRGYGSLHLTEGVEGPLGPQWILSLGSTVNLTKLPDGDMLLTNSVGLQAVFASKGGGEFTAPKADAGLVLTENTVEGKGQFVLKDGAGNVTTFTLSSGGGGNLWLPTRREHANGLNATTVSYQTVGSVTEPTQVLAPKPAGVSSCIPELVKGCRALGFVYASKTTATGDAQGEWGDYNGRLKEITFMAWDLSAGKMVTKGVAQYQYDKEGKLRAEWNPLVSPTLKTTYGYDGEGHVTSVSPAGQQRSVFAYGMIAGDPRTGRLLSVTRPSAATTLGTSAAPVNTSVPTLSTNEPVVGGKITVSTGTWSNSPLAYSYQWYSCTYLPGHECKPILGTTNQSYVPLASEHFYSLYAEVRATNGNGTTSIVTAQTTKAVAGFVPKYLSQFGSKGTGNGQFSVPRGAAVDTKGHVWITDKSNYRVQQFTPSGEYVSQFGSKGSGNGQFGGPFQGPQGIAADSAGELWVADPGNNRVQEFNEEGKTFVRAFGTVGSGEGQFHSPVGLAFYEWEYEKGHVESGIWVVDKGNDRVQRWSTTGTYQAAYGSEGNGEAQFKAPEGIAADSSGDVWVADTGNNRVEELSYFGKFVRSIAVTDPTGVAIDPHGDVWVAEGESDHLKEFSSTGESLVTYGSPGTGNGQFGSPWGMAFDASGNHMWVVDSGNNRTQEFTVGEWGPPAPPSPGTSAVTTLDYHVPVSGVGAPYPMGKKEVEGWGQKDVPSEATAVFPPDEPMGWPAQDYKRASLYYLDAKGHTVNTATPSGGISTTEYNATNNTVRTLSADNRAAALKEGSKSAETSKLLDTQSTYNSEGTELQSTLGPQHAVKLASGTEVQARDHAQYSYDEGAPAEGGPYHLVTKLTNGAQYSGKEEDIRTTTTSYSGQENLGWKLRKPTSVTTDPSGLKLLHTTLYESETGDVSETRMPASPGASSPHDTQTIYYTTAKNETYKSCGEHPEWANLPCQTKPAKQPETSGIPNLPETTVTYNFWDEPEKTTETVGTTTRTKTATYDAAGRLKTSAISSTVGIALPTVTNEYNKETGALEKQSTTTEGKTKTITSVYNTLGELTSYTDADENTATYNYDIDGRAEKTNDGKGTQTYTYDTTTGFPTKVVDSAAGTFTAGYDAEGNMLTEGYPNGMNATYTYNAIGKPTGLQYVKTTHCTEKCTWISDSVVPSIHGQWLSQASTLSSQSNTYDAAGRLTQVQNTPAGKGCTTRIYAYDEDTNRMSLTTREPGSEGKCATEGGTVEKHSYDTADRLTDTGASYSTFGNITGLSAADAGGTELTSAYYTDNQLQSETQNGQTIGYNLDPAGRTREIVSTGKKVSDVTNHYAGPGSTLAWTMNTSGEWTRNIPGLSGFAAVQNNGETPVLQLTNLHGDIIATAYLSETATALASTADTSEFGVPTTSLPPKYSWLGANEIPTELPSGVLDMGARSYVPQLGRFLQPDPVSGGSANAYAYVFGDPVNASDPSGQFAAWFKAFTAQNNTEIIVAAAAREKAAEEEAARKAMEAAEAAYKAAGPQYGSGGEEEWGEEEEWYEEEEGEYEYASYKHERQAEREASFGPGMMTAVDYNGEPHAEDAVRRPFENEENGSEYHAPGERCGSGTEGANARAASSGGGQREDVRAQQCPKRAPGYYKNRPHHGGGGGHKYKNVCVAAYGAVGGLAGGTGGGLAGAGVGAAPGSVIGGLVGVVVGEVVCQ